MSSNAATSSVLFDVTDGIGTLTLNRPTALNAIDFDTIERLHEVIQQATTSNEVRAILLTGKGRAFCAGGDVKLMQRVSGDPSAKAMMLDGVRELHRVLAGLYSMPKPVVAAVNGPAAGAGVGLALTADIVWVGASANFTLAFSAIGMSPDSGTTFLLPRVVGPKAAAELFLTGRVLSAEEALEIALVSRVLADDELLPAAHKLTARLAEGPTQAYARVKSLLRSSSEGDFERQLEKERLEVGESTLTEDFAEGLQAFVEKRRPRFTGR